MEGWNAESLAHLCAGTRFINNPGYPWYRVHGGCPSMSAVKEKKTSHKSEKQSFALTVADWSSLSVLALLD